MDTLIRKKIILHLLDCDSKSANEIANEIGDLLAVIEEQLTALASENICDKVNQDQVDQYVVKKDIETFSQLVKVFLSEKEEDKDEIKKFITSEYYFARIDNELVNYILRRFHLETLCQDDYKHQIGKILLVSPSFLLFALHGSTASFDASWTHWSQLNQTPDQLNQFVPMMLQSFMYKSSEMLFRDIQDNTYTSIYTKCQVRLAKIEIQISLATVDEQYIEAIGRITFGFYKASEDLAADWSPGQLISLVDPMDHSNDGLAFSHLGEFEAALNNFNNALDAVPDPIQKAIVLNNKGWTFLQIKQYQKAIECFEEGIVLDSKGEIPELRENKQLADKYLIQTTDADDLTQPTQVRFVQGLPVPFEETLLYEFKEVRGRNPVGSITNTADEYAVAFLNSEGGRIFWGIRNDDRIIVGVNLDDQQRAEVRRKVSEKLWGIRPPINDEGWDLEFHNVYDLQGNTAEDLWVVELVISLQQEREVFYTNSGELFVKTQGGKQKLLGPQVTEFIRSRLQNDTETD